MELKWVQVVVGNLEIDFNTRFNRVTVSRADLMPRMDMQAIPDGATLFSGTAEEFEDFMQRMWRKYGHLYGKR